ncbi:KilA-N domain-containing protein [Xanthobacter sp. V3C-3]|uniref:KilA-N domain-containing protein n=1 Tax=Xanthobacter lutulentifluminis TaxID=3119935 RepID=UPI003727D20A
MMLNDVLPPGGARGGRAPLVYDGVEIHDRGEMLCLTDMWKAQGSDPARNVAEWLRSADAKRFIEVLAEAHNMGISHVMTKKGKNGGTYAHWQIGLAYAKYLSPEFHIWCNTVVRQYMEGHIGPQRLVLDEEARTVIGGIVKSVLHAQLTSVIPAMVEGAMLEGGHVVSTDYKPALQVLIDKKVPARKRRAFSQKVSARLRRFALETDKPPRLSRETNRYLFHVDTIRDWLAHEGNALIAAHVAAQAGQGVLPFKKR